MVKLPPVKNSGADTNMTVFSFIVEQVTERNSDKTPYLKQATGTIIA